LALFIRLKCGWQAGGFHMARLAFGQTKGICQALTGILIRRVKMF